METFLLDADYNEDNNNNRDNYDKDVNNKEEHNKEPHNKNNRFIEKLISCGWKDLKKNILFFLVLCLFLE